MSAMQPTTRLLRYLALSATLALMGWVILWQTTLSPILTSTHGSWRVHG
ncbi:hypothetical protein JCM19237_73 [Photobacterium aphoticum]|uniref:Uncharacterized protein n=1 Tax=Photobacterium aphoticum TaxID=754436 RepID=A0A090RLZ1_9GAMM|nr:hypothetical protein JCM19237_73 [Photobacterium aphoticum]